MSRPDFARAARWTALVLGIASLWAAAPGTAAAQEIQVSGASSGEMNVYIAEEGDTLYDIADRFFGDPDYWPTLWSFNPHITNPNWIFPGDQVFLVPPQPKPEQARDGYRVTESRYSAGPQVELALGRRVGFLSEEDFKGSGVLSNSREEKRLLSETDEAYIRFETQRRVKAGDLFLAYRVEGKVKHPVTKKKLGYVVRYLGISKVTSTDSKLNKGVVLMSFEEIERGDRVAPFAPLQRLVPPIKNASAVAGYVVYTYDGVTKLGEYHYVVVDRGTKDGVQAGNRFVVREKGDGVDEFNPKPKKRGDFPDEIYGEILVIEAGEESSLGIVTYANREFAVGAPVDMLAGY
jgi:hypothetical protein